MNINCGELYKHNNHIYKVIGVAEQLIENDNAGEPVVIFGDIHDGGTYYVKRSAFLNEFFQMNKFI